MKRKLTPEEIAQRREAADGYWETKIILDSDLKDKIAEAKVIRAKAKEAMVNFASLQDEILSGEVEVDPQGRLI